MYYKLFLLIGLYAGTVLNASSSSKVVLPQVVDYPGSLAELPTVMPFNYMIVQAHIFLEPAPFMEALAFACAPTVIEQRNQLLKQLEKQRERAHARASLATLSAAIAYADEHLTKKYKKMHVRGNKSNIVNIPTDFARYASIVSQLNEWQEVPMAFLPTIHYCLWNGVEHLIQRGYNAPPHLASYEGYKMVCLRHGIPADEIPTPEQHAQLSRYIWGRYLHNKKEEIEYYARWQATCDMGIQIATLGGWLFGDV